MAKRPSVQEILEAARKGGAAKPAAEPEPAAAPAPVGEVEEVEASAVEPLTAPSRPAAPAPSVPSPAPPGRPLTHKEKLAAARAGGAATTAPAPAPAAAAAPAPVETATVEEPALAVPEARPAAVPPPAKPLDRPLTLQEKLAAARGAASAAPAAGPTAKPAAPKTAAAPAAKTAGATRVLPPLEKITDPRDLAEALRQAGAKKTKEAAAKAADAAPAKPAVAAKPAAKPQSVLPKPAKNVAAAPAGQTDRRGFMIGSLFISWVAVGWTAFTAGCVAFTGMMGRFMFPNVLAEPPSTMKVGEPSSYDPNDVNERFKAEGGFWIVRSNRYNGQDIIYALQTVCTHLGCPPNWLANEQKFKCPCHGSGFYITGINFEGPAPRPLERFKVTLADDGQIVVDKSQKFQQELGQWSDPDSFIAV
ncbi:MAG: QcrA and Rieske domain-containing protein [Isosphaeraceae bacterium]